jgi:GT2 family glycosyltransferase
MQSWNDTEQPRAVVIVLNWNGKDVIRDCLAALEAQTFAPFRVMVVDNASADDSPGIVSAEFPGVCLLQLDENTGFACGNNEGIREVWKQFPDVPYIILLNNDTNARPEWLVSLVTAADNDKNVGAVACKLVCWDGSSQPEVIDTAGDLFYKHGLAGKRGHGQPVDEYSQSGPIFGACAGAALYRTDMLRETGLFDEDFFAYNEDVDLAFRARLNGWQCLYAPAAVVWHRVSFTTVTYSDNALYWAKRNTVWVMVKNLPGRIFFKYLFSILFYNLFSDVPWLVRGRAKPVLRGRLDALKGLKRMWKKRRRIQREKKVPATELDRWITRETPWRASIMRNIKDVHHVDRRDV